MSGMVGTRGPTGPITDGRPALVFTGGVTRALDGGVAREVTGDGV